MSGTTRLPSPLAGTNQCDGCRAGMPLDEKGGIHRGPDGRPYMFCVEHLYEGDVRTGRCASIMPDGVRCHGEQGHLGFHWHWSEP